MSLYVAAYDIAGNRRRNRIARILSGYGMRVQRSVFEVWLEPEELAEFRRKIGPHLAEEDDFDLFPVDERGPRRRLSWQRPPGDWSTVVVL